MLDDAEDELKSTVYFAGFALVVVVIALFGGTTAGWNS